MKTNSDAHIISGPSGDIEVRIKQHGSAKHSKLVVISHPHPLYGGTMNNKVVITLERAFYSLGYHTVAYNFRGVGASQGEYDNGEGEQQDLQAVLKSAQQLLKPEQTVLAGFSFGSYVLLKGLAACSDVDAICTVAPPVGLYDFSAIETVELPWVMIQGGEDEVVDAKEIMDWAMCQKPTPDIYLRAKASHFFHGELVWMRKLIESIYC